MTEKSCFNQRGQAVYGDQTNIAGDLIYEQSVVPPIPHQIQSPPVDFIGRDEELRDLLSSFDKGATITGLRGMGGIGKTTLAFKLGELLRDRYPDGQLMVNLQGTGEKPLVPADAMAQVIRSYLPTARLPEVEAELAGLYRSVLDGKCALLLLDNALDDRQVRLLLPPARCGVIVTSRRKFTLPGLIARDLDILKLDKAVELLLKVVRPDSPSALPLEEKYWNEIASLCGFLPLALRAAGSMLANSPDLSLAEFVEELRDKRQRLERIGKEGVDLDVGASFGLSYNRLIKETARVFGILSIFPADFDAQAEEAICQDDGHRHLSELVRWSLVEYQYPKAEGKGRYHLHDLVRIFATEKIEEAVQADTQQRHAVHYKNLLASVDKLYMQGGDSILTALKLFDIEEANIKAGQAWAEKNLQTNSSAAKLCASYPDVGIYVLTLRFHPQQKIAWLEIALSAARQLKDRGIEGVHLGNLGLAFAYLGDIQKAMEYHKMHLAIAQEMKDRSGEGKALSNLGLAYAILGDSYTAIEYYKPALSLAQEMRDKRGEGSALGNLGNAYADLGNTHKAIEYYERVLAIDRIIGDRQREGADLGNLGIAYKNLGDTTKAIEYHELHLAIAQEMRDQRGESEALGNLGNICCIKGDAHTAIEYYDKSLKILRDIGDKRSEGYALGNIGAAYSRLGDTRNALDYCDQHLAIAREIGDRIGEGNALFNMSILLDNLGQRPKAIGLAISALAIFEQMESPKARVARERLGKWLI